MKKKEQPHCVLFDLDGTLLDTAPDLTWAINQVLLRHSKPTVSIETLRPYASLGSPGIIKRCFNIETQHVDYKEIKESFFKEYEASICQHTQLFSGMEEVLQTLKQRHIPWGIVTNKHEHMANKILDALKLRAECQCLVGPEGAPQRKPAPDGLLRACELMGCQPQGCVYVGDAKVDMLAAKAAGMTGVVAVYGYTPLGEDPYSWPADAHLNQPTDLIDYLSQ